MEHNDRALEGLEEQDQRNYRLDPGDLEGQDPEGLQ